MELFIYEVDLNFICDYIQHSVYITFIMYCIFKIKLIMYKRKHVNNI
ncbi:Uncharacterised protein [[Clostridium] sordellii]|nr:Uncharacterised protein [[Clostridium] sordellii] [Paeniclostridium sordellii]